MSTQRTAELVDQAYEQSILPALTEFIRIPCLSPGFDPDWEQTGHLERAAQLILGWCTTQGVEGLTAEIVRLEGRTPVVLVVVEGRSEGGVLLYGHLDKQPEMTGWDADKGPWEPVVEDGKLYGRGGADDGYAAFASLAAIAALQKQGVPHARCVLLIEACEESGSYDLPAYIDALKDRIGDPELIVCLDSGCGNYEQLWATTSLRGYIAGVLKVETISEGVHSGDASGLVPSSFRVLRTLLSRIEDQDTGEVLLPELHCELPPERLEQARAAAAVLQDADVRRFPFHAGVQPMVSEPVEILLNRTWRPALSVTGVAGMPPVESAGNVLRPETSVVLSMRVGPSVDASAGALAMKRALESAPPYGAKVEFKILEPGQGWNAPEMPAWLLESIEASSERYFGKPAVYRGEGGSIPFMNLLGERFPKAAFLITGVCGPGANAHGPNEFLELACTRKLTCCVADVLARHGAR